MESPPRPLLLDGATGERGPAIVEMFQPNAVGGGAHRRPQHKHSHRVVAETAVGDGAVVESGPAIRGDAQPVAVAVHTVDP